MYKLFLTLRYLTRKAIVIFPILAVWLCVAMLIIVTSIMGGFADRVRQTNRDFTGDIVVTSDSFAGFPYYAEMQEEFRHIPEVEISTPTIQAFGLLNTSQGNLPAVVYGVKPEERARVTKWRESLFYQYKAPEQATEDLSRGGFPASTGELEKRSEKLLDQDEVRRVELHQLKDDIDHGRPVAGRGFNVAWLFLVIPLALVEWLLIALTRDAQRGWRWVWWVFPAVVISALLAAAVLPLLKHQPGPADRDYQTDAEEKWKVAHGRAQRAAYLAQRLPVGQIFKSQEELRQILLQPPAFNRKTMEEEYISRGTPAATQPAKYDGVIVGVDMASHRDRRGNYDRDPLGFDLEGRLIVAPVIPSRTFGSTPVSGINAQTVTVRIIDDSYSGVFDVDKDAVYADFDLVQKLALMQAAPDEDVPGLMHPARANSIEIKITGEATPERLAALKIKIAEAVERVESRRPGEFPTGKYAPKVLTWDEKQKGYIDAVVNEKNMITFILLLLDVVVLVVIFLIFYIIVRDKTRDIGIIKAVGGSEMGVANIFTLYGAVIGIIGGLAGVATGMAFVRHTNEIHEWIYQTFGILIWKRDVYMFDRIPDQYDIREVALYFLIAVVAGILGALIPALVAGFQNPIRALRHE
jgi:ABC-type lipoprotein release transport system permease subunit